MIKDLNKKECIELLQNSYIGRLAFNVGESPYIVPITYYFDQNNNNVISYALEGQKIDAMRKNQSVSMEVDVIDSISQWKSVLVHGQFEELQGIDAKSQLHEFSQGVKDVINRNEAKKLQFIHEFSSKLRADGASPIVYRIKISEITGKFREE